MTESPGAFLALNNIAQAYAHGAKPLPAQVDYAPVATVICFSVLGRELAVPLDKLAELLPLQQYTVVPRVKRWMRGIANVRGKLLPIIDFADYLGGQLQESTRGQRMLVIDSEDIHAGLLVDGIRGMRHFTLNTYKSTVEDVPDTLAQYVVGGFEEPDGNVVPLFEPEFLALDEAFRDAAIKLN
ncbi:MAG: CheW domain-containing protein [Porticoccaceae bacterium]